MSDGFRERILTTGEDGSALSNSTTATSLLPAGRKLGRGRIPHSSGIVIGGLRYGATGQ